MKRRSFTFGAFSLFGEATVLTQHRLFKPLVSVVSCPLSDHDGSDEELLVSLLHRCLERIELTTVKEGWRNKFNQAFARVQSLFLSERGGPSMQITAFQMDCLINLLRTTAIGDKSAILMQAKKFSAAFQIPLPRLKECIF